MFKHIVILPARICNSKRVYVFSLIIFLISLLKHVVEQRKITPCYMGTAKAQTNMFFCTVWIGLSTYSIHCKQATPTLIICTNTQVELGLHCQHDIVVLLQFVWIACSLTLWRLETPKLVIGKQCRPRSDTADAVPDLGLHCFANSSNIFL